MSMNGYSGAGPIMAGLAAMSEPDCTGGLLGPMSVDLRNGVPAAPSETGPTVGAIAILLPMIENVADQVSEIAAQMVDIRKRLDALEKHTSTLDRRTVGQQLYGGIVAQQGGILNNDALQAQQSAMRLLFSSKLG